MFLTRLDKFDISFQKKKISEELNSMTLKEFFSNFKVTGKHQIWIERKQGTVDNDFPENEELETKKWFEASQRNQEQITSKPTSKKEIIKKKEKKSTEPSIFLKKFIKSFSVTNCFLKLSKFPFSFSLDL